MVKTADGTSARFLFSASIKKARIPRAADSAKRNRLIGSQDKKAKRTKSQEITVNEVDNPYSPGAGVPPPELAGRDDVIEQVEIAIARARKSKPPKNFMLLGLRGVGKTVLLQQLLSDAGEENVVEDLEVNPHRPLSEQIAPHLLRVLIKLDRKKKIGHGVKQALGLLQSFAAKFEVKIGDYAVGVTKVHASGDLQLDLADLFQAIGEAARKRGVAVILAMDEVQYLSREDLTALIIALHGVGQRQLPLVFLGAGLPQLAKLAGDARSYAERLFIYPEIGRLDDESARQALVVPAAKEGASFEDDAIAHILRETDCYPYFLQVWGDKVWQVAQSPHMTLENAKAATNLAIRYLDESFFRVRLDRLTETQQEYARAMAACGPGPVRTADVAEELGIEASRAAPIRREIVKKGMAYSQQRGMIAFTVPKFEEFMQRVMP